MVLLWLAELAQNFHIAWQVLQVRVIAYASVLPLEGSFSTSYCGRPTILLTLVEIRPIGN